MVSLKMKENTLVAAYKIRLKYSANVLVLTQLRYAANGVSYVVVSSENNLDFRDGCGLG